MNFIPGKTIGGIWTIVIILMILVAIMFLNQYAGPNRQPLFSFLKKKPTAPPADPAATV